MCIVMIICASDNVLLDIIVLTVEFAYVFRISLEKLSVLSNSTVIGIITSKSLLTCTLCCHICTE
jgi:hypothetical protein